MIEKITPTNVGLKINEALEINDDQRNMMIFEMGSDYFQMYADGDEEFRRRVTTGDNGKAFWNWFTRQFYMASTEFLNTPNLKHYSSIIRRELFRELIPQKICRFYLPYDIVQRLINTKKDGTDTDKNTGTTDCQVPGVAQQSGEQE
jgi:hypothetical protein